MKARKPRLSPSLANFCGNARGGSLKKITVKHIEGKNGEPEHDVVIFEAWPRECPICWQEFKKGWAGLQSHWKAHHEDICGYEEAWAIIQRLDKKPRRMAKIRPSLFRNHGKV